MLGQQLGRVAGCTVLHGCGNSQHFCLMLDALHGVCQSQAFLNGPPPILFVAGWPGAANFIDSGEQAPMANPCVRNARSARLIFDEPNGLIVRARGPPESTAHKKAPAVTAK